MTLKFSKWEALGNDFILIDANLELSSCQIAKLCSRKFGIGADGLILLNSEDLRFPVCFYNQDGSKANMCGNGLRTAITYLYETKNELRCLFWDKNYSAFFEEEKLFVQMPKPLIKAKFEAPYPGTLVDVTVPHFLVYDQNLDNRPMDKQVFSNRYHSNFGAEGSNISFYKKEGEKIFLRTCERGVEEETLSCGSASVALASLFNENVLEIVYKLGQTAKIIKKESHYFLSGKTKKVFTGEFFLAHFS